MSGLEYLTVLGIASACLDLGKFYSVGGDSDTEEDDPSEGVHDAILIDLEFLLLAFPGVKDLIEQLETHTADDTRVIRKSSVGIIDLGLKPLSKKMAKFLDTVVQPYLAENPGEMDLDAKHDAFLETDLFKAWLALYKLVNELPDVHKYSLPEIERLLPAGSPTDKLVYDPLPTPTSIRLIRIESRSLSYRPHLRLSFRTVDLADSPVYNTLSYTWGKPFAIFRSREDRDDPGLKDIQVECSGAVLEIGENLYRFLSQWQRALTHRDQRRESQALLKEEEEEDNGPPMELWIDAISINQGDDAEKAQQVGMMAQIYSSSSRTFIWLGEDDAFSTAAVRVIRELAAAPLRLLELDEELPEQPDEICSLLGLPQPTSWPWFSVFAFVNRSWFRRSWVVQEAALSPKLQFICGTSTLSWGAMANACNFMQQTGIAQTVSTFAKMEASSTGLDWLVNEEVTYVETKESTREDHEMNFYMSSEINEKLSMGALVLLITQVRHADVALASQEVQPARLTSGRLQVSTPDAPPQTNETQSVIDLWELSRKTMCGDPRDKVFAFVSLAHRSCYRNLNTSESRKPIRIDYTLSVADVFLQGAWYTLLSDSNLDLLSRARSKSLPKKHSLPSWVPDWSEETGLEDFRRVALELGWSASGDELWTVPEPQFLHQPRLPVQGVYIGSIADLACEDTINYAQAVNLASKLPSEYEHAPGQQSRFEVLWRTLVLDSIDDLSPAPEVLGFDFQGVYSSSFLTCVEETNYGTSGDIGAYYEFVSNGNIIPDFRDEEKRFEKSRPEEKRKEHIDAFERKTRHFLTSRKLVITDSKHFGLADGRATAQDKIFVVLGAATPLVLRPRSSDGKFELVGEAYVHGVMYGELLGSGRGHVQDIILD